MMKKILLLSTLFISTTVFAASDFVDYLCPMATDNIRVIKKSCGPDECWWEVIGTIKKLPKEEEIPITTCPLSVEKNSPLEITHFMYPLAYVLNGTQSIIGCRYFKTGSYYNVDLYTSKDFNPGYNCKVIGGGVRCHKHR